MNVNILLPTLHKKYQITTKIMIIFIRALMYSNLSGYNDLVEIEIDKLC